MKYYELSFTLSPSSEAFTDVLSAMLAEVGFESFLPAEEGTLKAYIQQSFYDEASMTTLLDTFPIPDVNIQWTLDEAADENWNETWENEGFQPIEVDNRLVVCDPRHEVAPALDRILIHPRQAFGTGSHQTTRMLLSTLLDMTLTDMNVIDAGCGTGILGFLCLKQGAKHLLAYDIDEWSVRNTLDNAQLNQLNAETYEVRLGDSSILADLAHLPASEKYDLLIANINRNILLGDLPTFAKCLKPHARILLSGFYTDDIPYLRSAASELGFSITLKREDGDWAMLLLES